MQATNKQSESELIILRSLQQFRNSTTKPEHFWQLYLSTLLVVSDTEVGMVLSRTSSKSEWRVLAHHPLDKNDDPRLAVLGAKIDKLADAALLKKSAQLQSNDHTLLAVAITTVSKELQSVAIFFRKKSDIKETNILLSKLLSVNDIGISHQKEQALLKSVDRQKNIAGLIETTTSIFQEKKFLSASMILCNELASRFSCTRVSLGWHKKGYTRVIAMSHTDEFEKKMEIVQLLEQAMEESFDQSEVISIPQAEGDRAVLRDHENYLKTLDSEVICSIPLYTEDGAQAICTLERKEKPFSTDEIQEISLYGVQTIFRLSELHEQDRWFGRRFLSFLNKKIEPLFGYEHTFAKGIGIIIAILLVIIVTIPVTYRVDSPFILRTRNIAYITAPFNSYIDTVFNDVGDLIDKGDTLLFLDRKDLILEEASLMAEINRHKREIEKARAATELADMRIAQARLDQTKAQLKIVQYKLIQSVITAPFESILIEGDQKEKIGSPVQQGEILFRLGRLDSIYIEIKVKEGDIQLITLEQNGEIALASRTQDVFEFDIDAIEPAAKITEEGNAFVVRASLTDSVPPWFRPGMTGISKINTDKRTFLWIITHETIDFLRMKFWW